MRYLAFFLIFGLGHPARDPVDPAKGVALHSRIPCDGFGGPEEAVQVQAAFSPGGSTREFVISRFDVDKCSVETMFQCWHKERQGWHDTWTASSAQPSSKSIVPLASCKEWGSKFPAQYVLSGWVQEGTDSKPAWRQVSIKQVSERPEAYEFADATAGTARLEIKR
jgi:hypothetical protein